MYIPGFTEVLIVKGFAWITAHLSATAATHLGTYIISHGIVSTITALVPIAITGSFIVGGVLWTKERVDLINKMLEDIGNGDVVKATCKLIQISNTLNTTCDKAADAVIDLLKNWYGENGNIDKICSVIKDIASNIKK